MPSEVKFETVTKVEMSFPNQQAFSINASTCRDVRYKSTAFKDWHLKTKAAVQMHGKYKNLIAFAETFKQVTHVAIGVTLDIYYPDWFFYNAKGVISSKTLDVTNFEKIWVDLIFDLLAINDKHIVSLKSTKSPAKEYRVEMSLEIVPTGAQECRKITPNGV